MYFVYNALLTLAAPVVWAGLRLPRFAAHRERWGLAAAAVPWTGLAVWVHAASVGELRAALPLMRALRARLPRARLVLSSTSLAGRALAAEVTEADAAFLLPFDLASCIERTLDAVRPRLFVFVETEIWPNLLRVLHDRSIPAVMVSGRISPRAFPRYRRLGSFLSRVLAKVSLFCMQSEAEAERIRALGAAAERVTVTGNLKLAGGAAPLALRVEGEGPLWIAASTHATEEDACVSAFLRLREEFPRLRLLLAPRHLPRVGEVEGMLARRSLAYVRRSVLDGVWSGEPAVLLLDTLGELPGFYGRADVAFVGGTLAEVGGHNLAEPARAGLPTLFGPHVDGVAEMASALERSGGGRRVADEAGLAAALADLLRDGEHRRAVGRAARGTFPETGAIETTMAALAPFLEAASV